MKKTLLALLSAALLITVTQPAQAEDQKVLAIIDTAIDSKQFPQVIHEVCFTTQWAVPNKEDCPNGQPFMEGQGAANLSSWPKSLNTAGAYHGDWMVKAALKIDPTIKVVFIRYAAITSSGTYRNDADSLVSAINWVSKNAEKYSIDALSISQSSLNLSTWCTSNKTTVDAVSLLNSKNVPVFSATGNNANANAVGFPSCVSGVIGVGALNKAKTGFEKATNGQARLNPGLDVATFGAIEIHKGNILEAKFDLAGSSGATVVSAATYLKNNKSRTFQEYLNALPKIVINTVSYINN
jgi:hypothetical protein